MERTCKQQYNCKLLIFSTFLYCFIWFENYSFLQAKIFTYSTIFKLFPILFQFLQLQVGQTLYLPGWFKAGFNPVCSSSTRWKKLANPAVVLPIHPFKLGSFSSTFSHFHQVEETYFFQEAITVSRQFHLTGNELVNSNTIAKY